MASLFNFSSADQENGKNFSNVNESIFNEKNNPKVDLLTGAREVFRNSQRDSEANFKLTNYSNNIGIELEK